MFHRLDANLELLIVWQKSGMCRFFLLGPATFVCCRCLLGFLLDNDGMSMINVAVKYDDIRMFREIVRHKVFYFKPCHLR